MPDLDELARTTGLIERQSSKFSASGFLLTMLKAVTQSEASFNQMANLLAQHEPSSMSRQALHKKLDAKAAHFLQEVLQHVISRHLTDTPARPSSFSRIMIEDSSQLRMHPANHSKFRGMTNQSGPTSAAKVDLIYDLLSGQTLCSQLEGAHVQDRTLGPRILEYIQEQDLIIRDMGYFDVASFQAIEQKNAFWISRLHGQAGVTLTNGKSLEKLLSQTDVDLIDCEVYLTAQRHPLRLIAKRLPEEITARRRQQTRSKRRRNGTNANQNSILREGWDICVTNLPKKHYTS